MTQYNFIKHELRDSIPPEVDLVLTNSHLIFKKMTGPFVEFYFDSQNKLVGFKFYNERTSDSYKITHIKEGYNVIHNSTLPVKELRKYLINGYYRLVEDEGYYIVRNLHEFLSPKSQENGEEKS